jgi:hypothetical protein
MCRRVQCERCHKSTYDGCGKHIEQVLRGILEADRCMCKQHAQLVGQGGTIRYEPSVITEQN